MSTTTDQSDREKILAHVRSIFDAYVRRDRETIERTHTRDWRGFLIPSSEIERGIEAYMKHADNSLERLGGTGYELHDTEIIAAQLADGGLRLHPDSVRAIAHAQLRRTRHVRVALWIAAGALGILAVGMF